MSSRAHLARNKGKAVMGEGSSKRPRTSVQDTREPEDHSSEERPAGPTFEQRFLTKLHEWGFGWEKSFDASCEGMGEIADIMGMEGERGWGMLLHREIYAYPNMVRDFYLAVATSTAPMEEGIMVRGRRVYYGATAIQGLLGLVDFEEPECPYLDAQAESINWPEVANTVLAQGETFIQDIMRFNQVKHELRMWLHFVIHNFFSSSNVRDIRRSALFMVHLAAHKQHWDVARLIHQRIHDYRVNPFSQKNIKYPVTITQLCLSYGVPIFPREERETPKETPYFSRRSVNTICRGRVERRAAQAEHVDPEAEGPSHAELMAKLNAMEEKHDALSGNVDHLQADFERFSLDMYDMMEAQMRRSGVNFPPRH